MYKHAMQAPYLTGKRGKGPNGERLFISIQLERPVAEDFVDNVDFIFGSYRNIVVRPNPVAAARPV